MIGQRVGTFILIASLVQLAAGARAGTQSLAYVVFSGQVALVDVDKGAVVRRMDFIDRLRPALRATLAASGDSIAIDGDAVGGGWGRIVIDRRLSRIERFERLTQDPLSPAQATPGVYPPHPSHIGLSEPPPPLPRRAKTFAFRLILHRSLIGQRDMELPVDQHRDECPLEELDRWTVTPDGARLLVVSTGGFKAQSYLRIYDAESGRRLKTVPLLRMLDDAPVALFWL